MQKAQPTFKYVRTKGIIHNARSYSVLNVGENIGYLLGQPLFPRIPFSEIWTPVSWAYPGEGRLADVQFDATGTEFMITTLDGELIFTRSFLIKKKNTRLLANNQTIPV